MKRLAIVEDNEDMQMTYRLIFRKSTEIAIVLQADTAEHALLEIPEAKPDLIIIDISLPGMDGIALTKELRKKYPDLKIIVITGHDKDAYEALSREAGADDFIVKGDGTKMIDKIRTLLGI